MQATLPGHSSTGRLDGASRVDKDRTRPLTAGAEVPEALGRQVRLDEGSALDLGAARRVSRSWHDLITRSPALQTALFLRRDDRPGLGSRPTRNPFLVDLFPSLREEDGITAPAPQDSGNLPSASKVDIFTRPNASWRRMLVQQCPAAYILGRWRTTLNPDSMHQSGELYLYEDGMRMEHIYGESAQRVEGCSYLNWGGGLFTKGRTPTPDVPSEFLQALPVSSAKHNELLDMADIVHELLPSFGCVDFEEYLTPWRCSGWEGSRNERDIDIGVKILEWSGDIDHDDL
ncbi:hypothetical protein JX265_008265 [Neoarthrinium moseri]|uniref:F-box domain-containing protein n=1 Tax=Neoarthrinium moseri TaxID=1658444 RepID=A0A9P9WIN2_9PEZI|nr:hypothetical protein JX265_008265 [Neoarthrinium moseri]